MVTLTQVCDVEWQHPVATAHGSVVESTVGVECGIRWSCIVARCTRMSSFVGPKKAKRQVVKPAVLSLESFLLARPQPGTIIQSQRLANERYGAWPACSRTLPGQPGPSGLPSTG